MINKTAREINQILKGRLSGDLDINPMIERVAYDTRQIHLAHEVMFVALAGERRDGHNYIKKAYDAGVRAFLIHRNIDTSIFGGSIFIIVEDTLASLQILAAAHRQRFDVPVIGITGSNGKTIVKEWLYQILSSEKNIAKSPKSFNSQLGVLISVFTINEGSNMAIIEAGISRKNEMKSLEEIVKPTIGILTYVGAAHSEGFESKEEKLLEKLIFFKDASTVIFQNTELNLRCFNNLYPHYFRFTWSVNGEGDVVYNIEKIKAHKSTITINYNGERSNIKIPFIDDVYLHNAFTCISYLIWSGHQMEQIETMVSKLMPISMRLELKRGMFNSVLINDTYNSDINSIAIAFSAAKKEAAGRKMVLIVSEFAASTNHTISDYDTLIQLINDIDPAVFIGVGEEIRQLNGKLKASISTQFFHSTSSLLQGLDITIIRDSVVLLKGARKHSFEIIVDKLEQRAHESSLEINLSALKHNLELYQSKIHSGTGIMVMIKASAYGSGSIEVARILQQQGVEYLSVAYIDEGIDLRKAGITLPIMVMNSGMDFIERMVEYDLEPEIYAPKQLDNLLTYLSRNDEKIRAHLKLDTGMHRLGFTMDEVEMLIEKLKDNTSIQIVSIFSHLAGSGEALFDDYTNYQAAYFEKMAKTISTGLRINPMKHILNSSGIARFPQFQYEMVRLGIGLYGFDPSGFVLDLKTVMTLKARISRIKTITEGNTVGYDRRWKALRTSNIATISIGYADGLRRQAGNGKWQVLIHGSRVDIVGSICMDMTMVDVTDIPGVQEGDEVTIFGEVNRADKLAEVYQTIPYEVFTGISSRVKRTYIME